MRLTDLLTPDRVDIERRDEGSEREPGEDGDDFDKFDKTAALARLASMLASGARAPIAEVERVLVEREALQSTGIGDGVAIPHGALGQLESQCAALLIIPKGVEFQAIDGNPVTIVFAVIGPKRATGEHLKTLARVSRLLRNRQFRDRLIAAENARAAYDLIATEETEPR